MCLTLRNNCTIRHNRSTRRYKVARIHSDGSLTAPFQHDTYKKHAWLIAVNKGWDSNLLTDVGFHVFVNKRDAKKCAIQQRRDWSKQYWGNKQYVVLTLKVNGFRHSGTWDCRRWKPKSETYNKMLIVKVSKPA